MRSICLGVWVYTFNLLCAWECFDYLALPQARNIACCVQLKDSDGKGSKPLPVIYSHIPGTVFCDRAHTTVLHHTTTPYFYTEVRVTPSFLHPLKTFLALTHTWTFMCVVYILFSKKELRRNSMLVYSQWPSSTTLFYMYINIHMYMYMELHVYSPCPCVHNSYNIQIHVHHVHVHVHVPLDHVLHKNGLYNVRYYFISAMTL